MGPLPVKPMISIEFSERRNEGKKRELISREIAQGFCISKSRLIVITKLIAANILINPSLPGLSNKVS